MSEYPATQGGERAPSTREGPGLLPQPRLSSAWGPDGAEGKLVLVPGSRDNPAVAPGASSLKGAELRLRKGYKPSWSHTASSEPPSSPPPMGSCTHIPHPAFLPRSNEGFLPDVRWPMANHLSSDQPNNITVGTTANMGPLFCTHRALFIHSSSRTPPALGGRP